MAQALKYGEDSYKVLVNVGKGKVDGKYHIYDLTEPKERNTPSRINGFASPVGNLLRKGVSNNSIPTFEGKSNNNFETGGKLIADLERLERKLQDVYNSTEIKKRITYPTET